jgi:hypothetical protein
MASTLASFNLGEFWEDLLQYVSHKRVIPVLGAELLTIVENGRQVPLYRVVAERLLKRYDLSATTLPGGETLRHGHELNDAVCALAPILAARGKRIKDLYPRIDEILSETLSAHNAIPESLLEIASIRDFDLFVTTTPDNLLVRALNTVRFNGSEITHEIEFAPGLTADRVCDIPERRPQNYVAVFYLFGKADVGPSYAIHDEDALEFPYVLQRDAHPERMFSALQSQNLLLIGCTFYDWLSRFFIRLSNSMRLSGDRAKSEFLVGDETAGDRGLTGFLTRFSHDSRCYPGDAGAFVAELCRRWKALPQATGSSLVQKTQAVGQEPGPLTGSVFISYAHDDIAAAKRLFADLEAIGSDVAWFDKTDLVPGDIWDSRIKGAIDQCRVFIPLLSEATEQRDEGYFKREWKRAAARYEAILGRKFIFPTVIDVDFMGDMGRYKLVPEVFKEFQYNHAPNGKMSDALREELTRQLRSQQRHIKAI